SAPGSWRVARSHATVASSARAARVEDNPWHPKWPTRVPRVRTRTRGVNRPDGSRSGRGQPLNTYHGKRATHASHDPDPWATNVTGTPPPDGIRSDGDAGGRFVRPVARLQVRHPLSRGLRRRPAPPARLVRRPGRRHLPRERPDRRGLRPIPLEGEDHD